MCENILFVKTYIKTYIYKIITLCGSTDFFLLRNPESGLESTLPPNPPPLLFKHSGKIGDICAFLAQSVEHAAVNRKVSGSIPEGSVCE